MIDIHDEMSDIWLSSVRLFRELLSSMWTNLFDNTLLGVLLGLSILFVVLWDEIPARYASQQRWLGGIAILLSSMTLVLDLIFSLCA